MEDRKLSVYVRREEETDFVVAYSPEDAISILRDDLGIESTEHMSASEWSVQTEPVTVNDYDDQKPGKVTKTPEEWIALNGRGHLACSYA